jgi:hypothetical protein
LSVEGPRGLEWPLTHWGEETPQDAFASKTLDALEDEIRRLAASLGR